MKEWEECIEEFNVIKVEIDEDKHDSLIETAKGRIKFIDKVKVGKNLNYIFEAYYTSCIEIIHAIALLNGYKIKNHICLCSFMHKILKNKEFSIILNKLRIKRNRLVYYGKQMNNEEAKEAINEIKNIIKFII